MIEIEKKNKQWLVTRICAKLRLQKGWSAAETSPRKVHDILDALREIHYEEEAKETHEPAQRS